MNKNNQNRGGMRTKSRSVSRYVTSSVINNVEKSSIAIVCAILVLALVTVAFFTVFAEDFSLPAWITASKRDPIPNNPDRKTPYATVTDKTNFVASGMGVFLSNYGLDSDYAILVRLSDMSAVAQKNEDMYIYPASMTKVMTVITALDLIEDLDDVYVVTKKVLNTVPSGASTASLSIFLDEGYNTVTVRDLLYGISYRSGADAVLCLIDYFGLTVDEFVDLMNSKADEIGLKNTLFGGAIGMDDEENQTTCRDVAALMAYAMENPLARELFSGGKHSLDLIEGYSYYHSTMDTLLANMGTTPQRVLGDNYTILAAKSGLETNAGYCLVSYIKNDKTGELFVLVTAHAEKAEWPYAQNPIHDMKKVFDAVKP